MCRIHGMPVCVERNGVHKNSGNVLDVLYLRAVCILCIGVVVRARMHNNHNLCIIRNMHTPPT